MWRQGNILMNRYEPAPPPQHWPLHCIQEIQIPEEAFQTPLIDRKLRPVSPASLHKRLNPSVTKL